MKNRQPNDFFAKYRCQINKDYRCLLTTQCHTTDNMPCQQNMSPPNSNYTRYSILLNLQHIQINITKLMLLTSLLVSMR